MAQTFARAQVGVREDLSDRIYNIDARDTPILSACPKGKALVNVAFDWQVDSYAAPSTAGVVDGTDVSSTEDAAENRARLKGYCQHIRRTPKVSNMTEIQDVAGQGVGQEYAKAVLKKTVELKRAVECVLGSDQESQEDNGTVAYNTRGLGKWIQSTAQSPQPVPSAYLPPAASIDTTAMGSVTTATINTVLESQYSVVGSSKSYMLVVGTTLKKTITTTVGYMPTGPGGTAILRSNRGDEGTWDNNIMSFTGDFGTYDIVLSNWLNFNNGTKAVDGRRGYALDMDMLELRMNKPFRTEELPNLGGGRRGLVEVIFGLAVKNPEGLAAFKATN
jgi:hypothetical protein